MVCDEDVVDTDRRHAIEQRVPAFERPCQHLGIGERSDTHPHASRGLELARVGVETEE